MQKKLHMEMTIRPSTALKKPLLSREPLTTFDDRVRLAQLCCNDEAGPVLPGWTRLAGSRPDRRVRHWDTE
jgi:hypothetical protein